MHVHAVGAAEEVTLLEFDTDLQEDHQEVQQQENLEEEGQAPKELPKCPDHRPSAYLKGKPQSILSLLYFTNTNLSSLCLMH